MTTPVTPSRRDLVAALEAAAGVRSDGDAMLMAKAAERIATLERMDREAATYVESVICMRTDFAEADETESGWKGLGAALVRALDERDALRAALASEPEPQPVAEPIAWRTERGNGLKRFITERQYRSFRPGAQRWYEPFRCASCAAPHPTEEPSNG